MDIDTINAIDPHRPPVHNVRRIWGRAGAGHHLTDPSPIVNTSESKAFRIIIARKKKVY